MFALYVYCGACHAPSVAMSRTVCVSLRACTHHDKLHLSLKCIAYVRPGGSQLSSVVLYLCDNPGCMFGSLIFKSITSSAVKYQFVGSCLSHAPCLDMHHFHF
jgi:hypothetical protein